MDLLVDRFLLLDSSLGFGYCYFVFRLIGLLVIVMKRFCLLVLIK